MPILNSLITNMNLDLLDWARWRVCDVIQLYERRKMNAFYVASIFTFDQQQHHHYHHYHHYHHCERASRDIC